MSSAMVFDPLERILHLRDRGRTIDRGVLHGHAQHRADAAPGEQRLQEPLRHRGRALQDQRGWHVTDGGQLGHERRSRRKWPRIWSETAKQQDQWCASPAASRCRRRRS